MTAQTKMCPACKMDKPRSDYYVSGSGKLLSRCILCHTEKSQNSRAKVDPRRSRKINDAYAKRERVNQVNRKYRLMQHYGEGRCAQCGVSDVDVLTLDHINNDGNKHRAELVGNRKRRSLGSSAMYKKIEKDGYPPIFQVLCFNCNVKKHLVQLREKFND